MDINQRKEQFSRAYVHAVASVAGYTLAPPYVDDDSVDLTLAARGYKGRIRSPKLDLQLKCTAVASVSSEHLTYPLKIKNYDDLRDTSLMVPRILVVVLIPEDPNSWLAQSEECLVMKHCAYWMSLYGMEKSRNRTTKSLQIPRTQIFDVAGVHGIMERIGRGGAL